MAGLRGGSGGGYSASITGGLPHLGSGGAALFIELVSE